MAVLFGVYGAVLGSFLALAGVRLARGESVVSPGSHCDGCGRRLLGYELVPVFSWIAVRGRCGTCKAPIPAWIPLLEGGLGAAWALCWLRFHGGSQFWLGIFVAAVLALMAAIDLTAERLPNWLTGLGALGTLVALVFHRPLPLWHYVAGAAAGLLLLLALRWASRGGMGLGDVKLFGWVGLTLGTTGMVLTLVGAAFGGALYGLGLAAARRLRGDHRIPFGPWVALAMLVVYLYGPMIRAHGFF